MNFAMKSAVQTNFCDNFQSFAPASEKHQVSPTVWVLEVNQRSASELRLSKDRLVVQVTKFCKPQDGCWKYAVKLEAIAKI